MKAELSDRDRYIFGLRQMATFLAMNPEVKLPWTSTFYTSIEAGAVRQHARLLKPFRKVYGASDFEMVKTFGPISVHWFTSRDAVCKKVVIGTEEIPEMIIPAKPEQFVPASEEQVIPAHTREITQWICSDTALLDDSAELPQVTTELQSEEIPF